MSGDASGAGAGDQQNRSGGGDQPVAVTEASVNEQINKALTSRFKTFEEKQTKTLEGLFTRHSESFGATLDAKLEAIKPAAPVQVDKQDPTQSPEYRAQQKQIDDLHKTVKQAQTEKAAERQKARTITLRQNVKAALEAAGVTHPHAAGILIDSLKLVDFADESSDNVIFRKKGTDETDLLETGLSEWLKSAEGKLYVPASGASGSGERPAGSGGIPPRFSQPANGSPASSQDIVSGLLGLSRG